jgi:hypothetical protein
MVMRSVLFVLMILLPLLVEAQTENCKLKLDSLTTIMITDSPEQRGSPDGGFQAFGKTIAKTIRYPQVKEPLPVETTTFVSFVIDVEGNIKGERVIREGIPGISGQLLKIIREHSWRPATCGGKPVASLYSYPLMIHLEK